MEEPTLDDITQAIDIKQIDMDDGEHQNAHPYASSLLPGDGSIPSIKNSESEATVVDENVEEDSMVDDCTNNEQDAEEYVDEEDFSNEESIKEETPKKRNRRSRKKEDSDSEFCDSEEERKKQEEEELQRKAEIEALQQQDIEEEENSKEESSETYLRPRRSSRKRKSMDKKREERAKKVQKTNEDPLLTDQAAIIEDPEELKERTDILHKQWQFLVVLHVIEHFREQLNIPESIKIPDVEAAVITRNPSIVFRDLMVCLLKNVRCSVHTSNTTWYRVLNIVLNRHSKWFEDGNPLRDIPEEEFFSGTDVTLKAKILHYICEWVLEESSSIQEILKEKRADSLFLRPLPLGWDSKENAYWRFGNSDYVYKEVNIDKEDGYWELVCKNVDEWKALAEKFKDSEDQDEQEFYSFLVEELIPPIEERAEAAAKLEKKLGRNHLDSKNIIDFRERPRRSARSKNFFYDGIYESSEDFITYL